MLKFVAILLAFSPAKVFSLFSVRVYSRLGSSCLRYTAINSRMYSGVRREIICCCCSGVQFAKLKFWGILFCPESKRLLCWFCWLNKLPCCVFWFWLKIPPWLPWLNRLPCWFPWLPWPNIFWFPCWLNVFCRPDFPVDQKYSDPFDFLGWTVPCSVGCLDYLE